MADNAQLKAAISNVIKTNGAQAITGEVLQNALLSMINSLGANYQFVGIATTSTNPGTPDQNVFYLAGEGTYTNFSNITIDVGQLGVLKWDGKWSKQVLEVGAGGGNMILDWNTDVATTRKQVLQKYRKPGIQISYNEPEKGWINEQYIGTSLDDTAWVNDYNWEQIPNQKQITDLGIQIEDVNTPTDRYSFIQGTSSIDEFMRMGTIGIDTSVNLLKFKPGSSQYQLVTEQFEVKKGYKIDIETSRGISSAGSIPVASLFYSEKSESDSSYGYKSIRNNIQGKYEYEVTNDGYIAVTLQIVTANHRLDLKIIQPSDADKLKQELDTYKNDVDNKFVETDQKVEEINTELDSVNEVVQSINGKETQIKYEHGSEELSTLTRQGDMILSSNAKYIFDASGKSQLSYPLKVAKGNKITITCLRVEGSGAPYPQIYAYFSENSDEIVPNTQYTLLTKKIVSNTPFEYVAEQNGYIVIKIISMYRDEQSFIYSVKEPSEVLSIKDYAKDLYIANVGNDYSLDTSNYYREDNNIYRDNNGIAFFNNNTVTAVFGIKSSELNSLKDKLYIYADYNPSRGSCSIKNGVSTTNIDFDSSIGCFVIDLLSIDKTKDLYVYLSAKTTDNTSKVISVKDIHITEEPWTGENLIKPNMLDGIFGVDRFIYNNDTSKTLQQAIDETKDGGTLFIQEGDYILPEEVVKIKHPINIIGIGNVRFLGGRQIKNATVLVGFPNVYSIEVDTDEIGYAYGRIWQDGISSEPIGTDNWHYLNNREHRLPSTELISVNSLDDLKSSDSPCYYKAGNILYFKAVADSYLSVNPIIINRNAASVSYMPEDKNGIQIWYNSDGSYLENIDILYSELIINRTFGTRLVNVNSLCSNNQQCLGIAKQKLSVEFYNCEFGGCRGDGMHSNIGYDIAGIVDANFKSCWFHDCTGDGVSSHSGSNDVRLSYYDCVFEKNGVTGSAPVNAKEYYANCLFIKNAEGQTERGGLRIVSVDGKCDVTCVNCIAVDNGGDAWSVQANSFDATLNLYGCKSILTENSTSLGYVYQKKQNKAGYINAYGCSNNYPQDKQSKITGEGKINVIGEILIQ